MKQRSRSEKDTVGTKPDNVRQGGKQEAHATIASATAAFALSRGWSMERINQACGASGLDLALPSARVPDDVAQRLWLVMMEEYHDEALALEMARAAPFSCFAGLAEGMQFAPDLRHAIGLLTRNRIQIADRLEMELVETDETAVLIGRHPAEDIDQGRTSEMVVALLTRMIREFLGVENALERIDFSWRPWGPPEAYQRYFGVPVEFDKPRTEIAFRKDQMTTPISHANTELFAFIAQYFKQVTVRMQLESLPPRLARLREAIADNAAIGEFSGQAAARRTGMSLRSAQRLCAAHGVPLSSMISQLRAEFATELLKDPRVTIDRVADLVGYSDDRAFRRAFKRWTGQTPSQFRSR